MKLLFCQTQFKMGGQQKALLTIAKELNKKNDVTVYYENHNFFDMESLHVKKLALPLQFLNLFFVIMKSLLSKKYNIRVMIDTWHLLNAKRCLSGDRYDVVVLLNPFILYVNEFKEFINTDKVVCWTHGTYEDYVNNRFKKEQLQLFESMHSSDKIISIEKETAKKWKKTNDDVSVIQNPVTIVNNLGDSNLDGNSIGFIGRIDVYQKGLDYFCEVVSKIDKNVNVFLAGSGSRSEEKKLHQLLRKFNIEKRVVLLGAIKGEELEKFYKSLSVLVMTSRYEGFGLVAIEGMEFGVPFVGFDINGLKEVTQSERYGMLVPVGNTTEMAKSISELLNDKNKLLRYSTLSKERAKQLSVESIGKKWELELRGNKKNDGVY